jgi:hypothetical protein
MEAAQKKKSSYGVLIWKDSSTGKEYEIQTGPWALLNSIRSRLSKDPNYSKGKFRLSYSSTSKA